MSENKNNGEILADSINIIDDDGFFDTSTIQNMIDDEPFVSSGPEDEDAESLEGAANNSNDDEEDIKAFREAGSSGNDEQETTVYRNSTTTDVSDISPVDQYYANMAKSQAAPQYKKESVSEEKIEHTARPTQPSQGSSQNNQAAPNLPPIPPVAYSKGNQEPNDTIKTQPTDTHPQGPYNGQVYTQDANVINQGQNNNDRSQQVQAHPQGAYYGQPNTQAQSAFANDPEPTNGENPKSKKDGFVKGVLTKKFGNEFYRNSKFVKMLAVVIMSLIMVLIIAIMARTPKTLDEKQSSSSSSIWGMDDDNTKQETKSENATKTVTDDKEGKSLMDKFAMSTQQPNSDQTSSSKSNSGSGSSSSRFANLEELTFYIESKTASLMADEKTLLNQYNSGTLSETDFKEQLKGKIDEVDGLNHLLVLNKESYDDEEQGEKYSELLDNINSLTAYGDNIYYGN